MLIRQKQEGSRRFEKIEESIKEHHVEYIFSYFKDNNISISSCLMGLSETFERICDSFNHLVIKIFSESEINLPILRFDRLEHV